MTAIIDGHYTANKLAWSDFFQANAESEENQLPPELLKKDVTTTCTAPVSTITKLCKDKLVKLVENIKPKKFKNNLNRFEREGLQWLKQQ